MDAKTRNIIIVVAVVLTCAVLIGGFVKFYMPRYKEEIKEVGSEPVPFKTEIIEDKKMWESEERPVRDGKEGERTYYQRWRYKYINDELKDEEPIGGEWSKVTTKPVSEIKRVGIRKGHPTGYIWRLRQQGIEDYLLNKHDFLMDISVSKMEYFGDSKTVFITLNIKNLPGSFEFCETQKVTHLIEITSITDPNNKEDVKFTGGYNTSGKGDTLRPGEEGTLVFELSGVKSYQSKDFKFRVSTGGLWGDWGNILEEVPLDKFWEGTFNKKII